MDPQGHQNHNSLGKIDQIQINKIKIQKYNKVLLFLYENSSKTVQLIETIKF